MKRIIMVAFIISVANKSVGQSHEPHEPAFSFDYTLAPTNNDGIDYSKTNFEMSVPVKLKKGLLINALGAKFYQFNYMCDYNFSVVDLATIYDISYGLKYTSLLSDTWEISAKAKVSIVSNLATSISYNDFLFNGEASITKIINKNIPETLTVGLNYSAITGKLRMLPTISYTKQVGEKFSFGIGFPNTYAEYKITDLSTLQSSLSIDGFYANLSAPIFVNTTVSKASFSSTSLALEYHYKMDDYWGILFKGGYAFSNIYKLIDSKNNSIFNFNTQSEPFFSAGIRFNLKTK